jgi:hypothetical protein
MWGADYGDRVKKQKCCNVGEEAIGVWVRLEE